MRGSASELAAEDAYEIVRERHMALFGQLLPASIARLDWSAARLRRERDRRLRGLLAAAKASSPFYAPRLAAIDPTSANEDDLRRIEPVTKDELMAGFDGVVTDRRLRRADVEEHLRSLDADAYLLGDLHAVASGGSTGRRGIFVWGFEAWAEGFASIVRHLLRGPARSGRQPDGRPMVVVAASNASHMTGSMPLTFRSPQSPTLALGVGAPLADTVRRLNDADPGALAGYASVLGELADEALSGRLSIRPDVVISTSEPLLPEVRRMVSEAWGASILNSWASSEFAGLATGCPAGPGLHLSDDLLVYEFVDADGRAVEPGGRASKVYVTNLYNHTMPLIRYELTDEVQLLEGPCPCGCEHRRVGDIEGRLDDGFSYGGVRVHPHAIRSVLGRRPGVVEYRVLQTTDGVAVEVRCDRAVDLADLEVALRDALTAAGMATPRVAVRRVDAIPRESTGKVRRFVPLA